MFFNSLAKITRKSDQGSTVVGRNKFCCLEKKPLDSRDGVKKQALNVEFLNWLIY